MRLALVPASHAALHCPALPVTRVSAEIRNLLASMVATMDAVGGIGLAACQVGDRRRLAVVRVGPILLQLVNPRLVEAHGERTAPEACLSLPGWRGQTRRAVDVCVEARSKTGAPLRVVGSALLAQVLQHEIDHLDGILYLQRVLPGSLRDPESGPFTTPARGWR